MLTYAKTRDAIWSTDFCMRTEYENTDPLKHEDGKFCNNN